MKKPITMKRYLPFLALGLAALPVAAQTKMELSSIIPGTESVQLIYNGDFQLDAPTGTNLNYAPPGWNRQADIAVGAGKNTHAVHGAVAQAHTDDNANVSGLDRMIRLAPDTEYVLSAYMWNFGDWDNNVIAVIDLNDAPDEPQITLTSSDDVADEGYFVYSSFNTRDTGTNVNLRLFYESPTGKGAAEKYFPIAAQWDNIAITKVSDFEPPQFTGMNANLRPNVSITSPADEAIIALKDADAVQITAIASDRDGRITNVVFYASGKKLGETSASPFNFSWKNATSGSYQLTAVASDNKGATTVSAPVTVSITASKKAAQPEASVDPSTMEKKK